MNPPEGISLGELRAWLTIELLKKGEPLRWAITAVNHLNNERDKSFQITVEAVLIDL